MKILVKDLKNNFDGLMSVLTPFVNEVFVEPIDDEDGEVITYKVSDWKKGINSVGNGFYGKSDLLQLGMKNETAISIIQLRKIISSGYGTMYRNQPVGDIIVEVLKTNSYMWKDFNMGKESDRNAFVEYIK